MPGKGRPEVPAIIRYEDEFLKAGRIDVSQDDVYDMMQGILIELQKINMHLSLITDANIQDSDVGDV